MSHAEQPDKWSQLPVDIHAQDFTPDFSGIKASSLAKKAESVLRITGEYQHADLTDKERTALAHQELVQAEQLFEELTDKYDIPHAGFRPFIGRSNDRPRAMVESDYIKGTAIEDETEIEPQYRHATRELLGKLTNYVTDKFTNDSVMLTDVFRISQYIFNEETGTFVLVDMDTYADADIDWKQKASKELREIAHRVLNHDELVDWYKRMEPIDFAGTDVNLDEEF